MSNEINKATIQKLVDRFWNGGDASVFEEAFKEDYVEHNRPPGMEPGREGLKKFVIGFRQAFSNSSTTLDDIVAEGNRVAWRWTFRGTHTGEVMGIPASGKSVVLQGLTLEHMDGGRITDRWSQLDMAGLMQQIGASAAPAGHPAQAPHPHAEHHRRERRSDMVNMPSVRSLGMPSG